MRVKPAAEESNANPLLEFAYRKPQSSVPDYVKVVQRVSVKIVFEKGQDPEHLLRLGMSVVPKVRVR
jgi:membrane fusion protein (multidrug efflux system)